MPANSVSTIAIYRDVSAVAAVKLSVQETGVRVRAIPSGSTTVALPASPFPNDGDSYEVIDADGSCGPANLVIVTPTAGTTIRGAGAFPLAAPFASARFTFDAAADAWTVAYIAGSSAPGLGDALWIEVAPGSTFAPTSDQVFLSCNTGGAQTTINLPSLATATDGQVVLVKCAAAMVSPVIVTAAAGTTIEQMNAPGTFNQSTWLPIQGQSAFFKYDKSAHQWKGWASYAAAAGAEGTPGYNSQWYANTAIAIDPQNVLALDSNTGLPGSPLASFAEAVRRYGSIEPEMPFGQNLLVELVSSQNPGTDAIFFSPKMSGGGQAVLLGTLIPNGAPFSPATVTAKNRATPQLLVLNTVPAGVVAKNLLQNTTSALRGWAFVDNVAATNATMSQPVANSSITTVGIPVLTEDNAWANTDTYQAYTLPLCNLKAWRPTGGDLSAGGVGGGGWVQFVEVADSSGAANSEYPMLCDSAVAVFSACRFDGRLHVSMLNGRGQGAYVIGCDVAGQCTVFLGNPEAYAGIMRAGLIVQAGRPVVDGDIVIHISWAWNAAFPTVGAMYSDGPGTVQGGSVMGVSTAVWGTTAITVNPGSAYFNNSGTTFALSLLTTGALKLGTSTTGSFFTPGTGLWTSAINITPANLDTNNGLQNPQTGARFCNPN
jgi:hypothetical protein